MGWVHTSYPHLQGFSCWSVKSISSAQRGQVFSPWSLILAYKQKIQENHITITIPKSISTWNYQNRKLRNTSCRIQYQYKKHLKHTPNISHISTDTKTRTKSTQIPLYETHLSVHDINKTVHQTPNSKQRKPNSITIKTQTLSQKLNLFSTKPKIITKQIQLNTKNKVNANPIKPQFNKQIKPFITTNRKKQSFN